MTLYELQKRINEVVTENEKRGWLERNNMPVAVELARTKTHYGRTITDVIPMGYLMSAQLTVGNHNFGATITARENDAVTRDK